MKILYINVLYAPFIGGGAEITLKHLAEGMKDKGHEVKVLSLTENNIKEKETIQGVDIVRLPIKNLYFPYFKNRKKPSYKKMKFWHLIDTYNPLYMYSIKKEIQQFSPDVISIHNMQGFSVAIWDILKSLKIPFVQVLHDQYLLCPANMFRNQQLCTEQCTQCKILRFPHKIKSKNVNVVGISNFILNKFLNYGYFNNAKVKKVIYNSRKFNQSLIKIDNRMNTDDIVFGYIGTLIQYKGIEVLLDLFLKNELLKKHKILIAGSGEKEYENFLKKKYKAKNIIFLGQVKQEEFFSNVDVTLVPSLWEEPLGMIVIESLLFGKPVITSNMGGLPEMIENGMGYIFDPKIKDDLVNKILLFIKNVNFFKANKESISKRAYKKFSYNKWLDEWESTYITLKDN